MRRRISVAMVVMVVVAVVIVGLVSLVLTIGQARQQTRRELVNEGQSLAVTVHQEATTQNRTDPARALRTVLVALRPALGLEDSAVLGVRADGHLYDPTRLRQAVSLPRGLGSADLDVPALLQQRTVSGIRGSLVYAAVPYQTQIEIGTTVTQVTLVVVLTRSPATGLASAGPWFLLSAAVIIALAVLVANRLGHRFVRPLEAARQVTGRIAAGDLEARVPQPAGTDPELASLTASINDMAAALARARGGERQFLLSVSHDLRTPLTSIRGFAEAIEDGATDDARHAAGVIASEARRLERLVRDLLALAHLEARRFSLDLRPLDVTAAANAAAAGFRPAADELGLVLDLADASGAVMAVTDPDRLAQVVANLTENALKYARSRVRIGTAVSAGLPLLWVDDDGPGIASEDLPRVFERLYSSRHRPGREVGTGLGLAIVAELVDAMGGTVRAESPLLGDGGTRVVVTLRPPGAEPVR